MDRRTWISATVLTITPFVTMAQQDISHGLGYSGVLPVMLLCLVLVAIFRYTPNNGKSYGQLLVERMARLQMHGQSLRSCTRIVLIALLSIGAGILVWNYRLINARLSSDPTTLVRLATVNIGSSDYALLNHTALERLKSLSSNGTSHTRLTASSALNDQGLLNTIARNSVDVRDYLFALNNMTNEHTRLELAKQRYTFEQFDNWDFCIGSLMPELTDYDGRFRVCGGISH